MQLNPKLKTYIEQNIFPLYSQNEPGHGLKHIRYTINRSFQFAGKIPNINYDIVYTVATYHDIGHHIDAKNHEKVSAEIMQKDENLKQFFSPKGLKIIKEAIEDHRSSLPHDPRSVYGKIISSADRDYNVQDCLIRAYLYGKKHHPDSTEAELFDRSHQHLTEKFGENGYSKFYFQDTEYENFLHEIRTLLADKKKFIRAQKKCIKNYLKSQKD